MNPRGNKPADWAALGRLLVKHGATDDPRAAGEALRQLVESGALVIVGLEEITALTGVTKQRTQTLTDRRLHPAMPEGQELARGRVWFEAAVVAYLTGPKSAGGLGRILAGPKREEHAASPPGRKAANPYECVCGYPATSQAELDKHVAAMTRR